MVKIENIQVQEVEREVSDDWDMLYVNNLGIGCIVEWPGLCPELFVIVPGSQSASHDIVLPCEGSITNKLVSKSWTIKATV